MDNPKNVSYVVYETAQARSDLKFKYMWVTIILLLVMLLGTNAGWIIYESQYQDVVMTENSQDGTGVNIIGGGSISYGSETDDH